MYFIRLALFTCIFIFSVLVAVLIQARWFYPPLTGTLALISDRDGSFDIFLLDIETLQLMNLTQTPNLHEYEPSWSPDGTQIAYVTFPTSEDFFPFPSNVKNGDLRLIKADGSQQCILGVQGVAPQWTPDGRAIVYTDWALKWPNSRGVTYPQGQLFSYDLYTGKVTPASPQPSAGYASVLSNRVWSRNGALGVQQFNYYTSTQVVYAGGGVFLPNTRQLLVWHASDPAPSPDGRLIALFTIRNELALDGRSMSAYNEGRISLIDPSGRWLVHLTPPLFGGNPTWSPTGHYLAYDAVGGNNHWGVEVIRANGQGWQALTPFDGHNYFAPAWRP